MRERIALVCISLTLPIIVLAAPFPIIADSAPASLPSSAQALLQALTPGAPASQASAIPAPASPTSASTNNSLIQSLSAQVQRLQIQIAALLAAKNAPPAPKSCVSLTLT